MANIGLIGMSAKPYHAGHDGLVRIAARENDIVYLFVSLSDRRRPGEIPILGKDMDLIWKSQIEPSLPGNVKVDYGGLPPVTRVYRVLEDAKKEGSTDTFTIYSDPDDLEANYPVSSLERYGGDIWRQGQIILMPVERSTTTDVSGKKMRQYLSTGNKDAFIANLPSRIDGEEVWNILLQSKNAQAQEIPTEPTTRKKSTKKIKSENLLRVYIKMLVS
jgi:hypothetical protein